MNIIAKHNSHFHFLHIEYHGITTFKLLDVGEFFELKFYKNEE